MHALLASGLLEGAAVVALFAAMPEEADPSGLEPPLVARGVRIAYPRVAGPGRLTFHLARSHELAAVGPWKIREPDASAPRAAGIDAYVVPGLGFTRDGQRLGYGKGFYDRVLESRGGSLAIGFALACQLVDELPVDGHDQPVDAVVAGSELVLVNR